MLHNKFHNIVVTSRNAVKQQHSEDLANQLLNRGSFFRISLKASRNQFLREHTIHTSNGHLTVGVVFFVADWDLILKQLEHKHTQ